MDMDEQPIELPDWFEAVYAVARAVPKGRVATYGQIAGIAIGVTLTARQVGAALRYAPADVPWQRVIGAGGRLPIAKRSPELMALQRQLLIGEGVVFEEGDPDRINMERTQWTPEAELENHGNLEFVPV